VLSLLLGAGFSKWSANLPLARELFDYCIEPWGVREARDLEIVTTAKANWDTEHPNGLSEQFIADALTYPELVRKKILWYIVRRLSNPFVWSEFHSQRWRRHQLMIDENRKMDIPGIVEAQKFLHRLVLLRLGGIITTNYDLIVEYALGTKGFSYGIPGQVLKGRGAYPVSQWRNPVALIGSIPLAKIHGSISWDEHGFYTDGRRGLTGNALIVAPTPEKLPPIALKFAWSLATEILLKTIRLVVFGFAFNPYDEAVLKLLDYSGSKLQTVLVIDVSRSAANSASQLWPHATVTWSLPPPTGNRIILDWLNGAY